MKLKLLFKILLRNINILGLQNNNAKTEMRVIYWQTEVIPTSQEAFATPSGLLSINPEKTNVVIKISE